MIEVTVDEKAIEPGQLEMHYQAEPFPGGSTYRIVIRDTDLTQTLWTSFGNWQGKPLPMQQAAHLFNLLRMYVSLKFTKATPSYWANTVETFNLSNDIVEVAGACSPHVA